MRVYFFESLSLWIEIFRKEEIVKEGFDGHEEERHLVWQLMDVMIEVLREKVGHEEEAFEEYAHRLRLRLYEETENCRDRIVKGYETLVTLTEGDLFE